jgi:hypothetical protein
MSQSWQFQPGTDTFGNRYLPLTTGQVFTGQARPAADAFPAQLTPGEYVIPAGALQHAYSRLGWTATTTTAQAAWAIRYIADAYGNRDEVMSARGVTWRVRPLTLEEMLA